MSKLCGTSVSSDVARAQVGGLQQRVPYLYAILIVNTIALAYTHHNTAAWWQVFFAPSVMIGFITIRLVRWVKMDVAALTEAEVAKIRQRTVSLGGLVGLAILLWAESLRHQEVAFWSAYMTPNGHVDFFIGITVVSCIFLLMHLTTAAVLISLIILVPFTFLLLLSGRAIEIAIGCNLLLVAGAMMYVAVSFARDFARMVSAQSDLERMNELNASLATSDTLTGLPNRRSFFQDLERSGAGGSKFAVVLIDLDEFKHVNDVYGHRSGDEVLIAIAARMQDVLPRATRMARLGGDEFACLLAGEHAGRADGIATALIDACRTPIACNGFTATIAASAGICLSDAAPDPTGAYERADYALFEAKRAGRGQVKVFTGEHDASMRRASQVAHLLRSGELYKELSTVYQPVVAAGTNKVKSFEALVRWENAELGTIGPNEFIPIAERTDLIFDISRYVLRRALADAANWPTHITLKVNLSIRDLMSRAQTEALVTDLLQSPFPATRITFELPETIFAESLETVCANVAHLRSTGCMIAIDDFGVGYSSLNYIHALSPDTIKVDRCFVIDVVNDDRTRRIIRTIVELARNVGAKSVAEGVETEQQARTLTELGCDALQGFYFSRPLSGAAALAYARNETLHHGPAALQSELASAT